jgi:hypothetical protein
MKLSGVYLTKEQIDAQVKSFRYIHDEEENQQIGLVVLNMQGRIGWSLFNRKKEKGIPLEPVSLDKGLLLALDRAKSKFLTAELDIGTRIKKALKYSESVDKLEAAFQCVQWMKAQAESINQKGQDR